MTCFCFSYQIPVPRLFYIIYSIVNLSDFQYFLHFPEIENYDFNKTIKSTLIYVSSWQKVETLCASYSWWRCGDLHSGLARFAKVFYILIRRLFSEKPCPSAGFSLSITT